MEGGEGEGETPSVAGFKLDHSHKGIRRTKKAKSIFSELFFIMSKYYLSALQT